jgi:hypothetical protein
VFWIGTFCEFFDQALLEQSPDRSIETAGTEAERSARAFRYVLHDRVSMAVSVRERDQDVKRIAVQRKE